MNGRDFTQLVGLQAGVYASPDSATGQRGGIEFNGVSYDSTTNLMLVPSTNECGIWKLTGPTVTYVAGQPYTGGALPTRGTPGASGHERFACSRCSLAR